MNYEQDMKGLGLWEKKSTLHKSTWCARRHCSW